MPKNHQGAGSVEYPLNRAGQLLAELPQYSTHRRNGLWHPKEGSPGEKELSSLPDRQAKFASELLPAVLLRLIAAEEFLSVAGRIVAADQLVYSLYPLCRSTADFSARVAWLLDPDISPKQRMQRAIGEVVESHTEQSRLRAPGFKASGQEKRRKYLEKAGSAGLRHEPPPKRTPAVDAVWGPEGFGALTYQLLSAFSHGTAYALHQLMFPLKDNQGALVESDVEGIVFGQVGTEPRQEAHALAMAIVPYRTAAVRWMQWSGHLDQVWDQRIVAIMGELRPFITESIEPRG